MGYNILLAEDDGNIRLVLSKALIRKGHRVKATDNPETLMKWVQAGLGDIILTDVLMGEQDVFDYLPDIAKQQPHLPIIIMSANNTVNTALKSGAHNVFEYIPKPFDLSEVAEIVERAGQTLKTSRAGIARTNDDLPMIGRSMAMQSVYRAVSRYTASDFPILITGDVGTGKDLIAQMLHDGGKRCERPFLRPVNFTETEDILQKANGGDIYIDEIGELSAQSQEHIMRLIAQCETLPSMDRPRIISSSRKDIRDLTARGLFRDDLLFRLNVAEIHIPTLAEREGDIYELAQSFLSLQAENSHRKFHDEALHVLFDHQWSGNVRELKNLVERLSVLYSDDIITANMVMDELYKNQSSRSDFDGDYALRRMLKASCRHLLASENNELTPYAKALSWIEAPLIMEALRLTSGNQLKAAKILGIHRNTLRAKLKTLKQDEVSS